MDMKFTKIASLWVLLALSGLITTAPRVVVAAPRQETAAAQSRSVEYQVMNRAYQLAYRDQNLAGSGTYKLPAGTRPLVLHGTDAMQSLVPGIKMSVTNIQDERQGNEGDFNPVITQLYWDQETNTLKFNYRTSKSFSVKTADLYVYLWIKLWVAEKK